LNARRIFSSEVRGVKGALAAVCCPPEGAKSANDFVEDLLPAANAKERAALVSGSRGATKLTG
jgi:hypothetical protein